eukprot:m.37760 g.37760  ORF g.37760 m.37760 type:complete len:259 (-) comp10126_c0_seq1:220-996(-)
MGCGGSKSAEVVVAPGQAPGAAPSTSEVTRTQSVAVAESKPAVPEEAANSGIIDESTPNGEDIAGPGNSGVDLSLSGTAVAKPVPGDGDDDDDDDDAFSRMTSATSTRSAPSIMQRPSSRGGSAFEIQWDDTGSESKPPRRLQKLQHSSRKRQGDVTLQQLQKKMQAAERRRKEYEKRIQDKLKKESEKAKTIQDRQQEQQGDASKIESAVDKAAEKREEQRRALREKLRAQEEKRRQVREKAERIKAEEAAQQASEA